MKDTKVTVFNMKESIAEFGIEEYYVENNVVFAITENGLVFRGTWKPNYQLNSTPKKQTGDHTGQSPQTPKSFC